MMAAAAPTVAPAMVPGDASRAMMTWSRVIGDGDMSGESDGEAENRCRSLETRMSAEGAKRRGESMSLASEADWPGVAQL